MPKLIETLAALKELFDSHAHGDKTLNKQELNELLSKEFGPPPAGCKGAADEFMKMLDHDGDGLVNFEEFVTFAAAFASIIWGK